MLTAGQKMTNKWKKILEKSRELLGSLLFPARCPVCDEILAPEEIQNGIHPACESKLYPIYGAVCMHCGRPLGDRNPRNDKTLYDNLREDMFGSVREYCYDCIRKNYVPKTGSGHLQQTESFITQAKSLYLYQGAVKTTMYRLKYSNKREYAPFFARRAVEQYGGWIRRLGIEVIVPVPMYVPKQRKRGYNQAETFARELSKQTGIPVNTKLVCRVADTTPQKELDEKERKNNLKNAFQTGKNVVQYSCAMVVDDIYTTGSTAEAVARELIKQGTRRVYLLTICIGGDR